MPRPDEYFSLGEVEVVAVTAAAALLVIDDEEVWIPKSQMDPDDAEQLRRGEVCPVSITAWIAQQKGIELIE
jgi:hypothetical protein